MQVFDLRSKACLISVKKKNIKFSSECSLRIKPFMHVTQICLIYWPLPSWIINEFETEFVLFFQIHDGSKEVNQKTNLYGYYSMEYKFNSQFSSSANYANIGFSLQKYCSWIKIWVYLSLLDSINEERVAADESPANGPFFHPRQMVANGGWPLNRGFS